MFYTDTSETCVSWPPRHPVYKTNIGGNVADLIDGAPLENGLHWSEDLIGGDDVVILHIAEDSGLNVVALIAQPLPATLQLGALLLPLLAHLQDLVKLLLGHLQPPVSGLQTPRHGYKMDCWL